MVEVVSWAAGNGDRSENGDYIYGKKRLREIDGRIRHLIKRLESAEVLDPAKQTDPERIYFGATVTCAGQHGKEKTCRIVGIDEAGIEENKISWVSPVTRALIKAFEGDVASLRTPDDDVGSRSGTKAPVVNPAPAPAPRLSPPPVCGLPAT